MKYLLIIFFSASFISLNAQVEKDTDPYQKRKIKKIETDILLSGYTQNGDHSAVTGGIGSEKLNDLATNIEVSLVMDGKKKGNENTINVFFGVDAYTSASSDEIDPHTISGASRGDTRVYPSLSYTHSNGAGNYDIGTSLSVSNEYDYLSFGLGLNYAKRSKDDNRELGIKLNSYFDQVGMIYPKEMRGPGFENGFDRYGKGREARFSNTLSLVYSQVLNKRMQFSILTDGVYQQGMLSTPFHRTMFKNGETFIENLPDSRLKLPIGLRLNYFMSDRLISKLYFRHYMDNWGVTSQTYGIELPVKITHGLSVYPDFRYYTQQGMDHFFTQEEVFEGQEFYSNDYDLSTFESFHYGLGVRYAPTKGLFNIRNYLGGSELNLKYGYYHRTDGLNAHILSVHMKFIAPW